MRCGAIRARSAGLRPVLPLDGDPAARRSRPVAGISAPQHRTDRRATVADVVLALFCFVLTWAIAIPAGIYSATHQRSWLDYLLTVFNYVGVATPNFMLALVLMWLAFAYFDISVTGLFSPEMARRPGAWAQVRRSAEACLAAGARARHRGHRAAHPRHARQPARRAEQALRDDRARQGHVGMAGGAALSGAAGVQPAGEHHRLVPAAAVLRLPDRGDGDEPAKYRTVAAALAVNQDMYLAGAILLIYCFLTIVGTLLSDILLAVLDPRIRMGVT